MRFIAGERWRPRGWRNALSLGAAPESRLGIGSAPFPGGKVITCRVTARRCSILWVQPQPARTAPPGSRQDRAIVRGSPATRAGAPKPDKTRHARGTDSKLLACCIACFARCALWQIFHRAMLVDPALHPPPRQLVVVVPKSCSDHGPRPKFKIIPIIINEFTGVDNGR